MPQNFRIGGGKYQKSKSNRDRWGAALVDGGLPISPPNLASLGVGYAPYLNPTFHHSLFSSPEEENEDKFRLNISEN